MHMAIIMADKEWLIKMSEPDPPIVVSGPLLQFKSDWLAKVRGLAKGTT
jgi:hypothetical protein